MSSPPICGGYGDSVGPDDAGANSINYSFRAMAQDQVEVMEKLGYCEFLRRRAMNRGAPHRRAACASTTPTG